MAERDDPFHEMGNLIASNGGQSYGGAFVIVPPGEEVKPRVMLMLNNSEDPAMFWASLQTTCAIALQELQAEQDQSSGFGMRR